MRIIVEIETKEPEVRNKISEQMQQSLEDAMFSIVKGTVEDAIEVSKSTSQYFTGCSVIRQDEVLGEYPLGFFKIEGFESVDENDVATSLSKELGTEIIYVDSIDCYAIHENPISNGTIFKLTESMPTGTKIEVCRKADMTCLETFAGLQ